MFNIEEIYSEYNERKKENVIGECFQIGIFGIDEFNYVHVAHNLQELNSHLANQNEGFFKQLPTLIVANMATISSPVLMFLMIENIEDLYTIFPFLEKEYENYKLIPMSFFHHCENKHCTSENHRLQAYYEDMTEYLRQSGVKAYNKAILDAIKNNKPKEDIDSLVSSTDEIIKHFVKELFVLGINNIEKITPKQIMLDTLMLNWIQKYYGYYGVNNLQDNFSFTDEECEQKFHLTKILYNNIVPKYVEDNFYAVRGKVSYILDKLEEKCLADDKEFYPLSFKHLLFAMNTQKLEGKQLEELIASFEDMYNE